MKTNKLINILLSGLLVVFSFSSCTSDFEEINTNKRVLAEIDLATVGNVYAGMQYNGLMNGWNFQTYKTCLPIFMFNTIQTGRPSSN